MKFHFDDKEPRKDALAMKYKHLKPLENLVITTKFMNIPYF